MSQKINLSIPSALPSKHALVYAHHHLYEEAFKELTHSADILATTNMDKLQNQDDYFTELNSWLVHCLRYAAATQSHDCRESLLQIINELPEFQPMKNDPRFQHCIRILLQKKEETTCRP